MPLNKPVALIVKRVRIEDVVEVDVLPGTSLTSFSFRRGECLGRGGGCVKPSENFFRSSLLLRSTPRPPSMMRSSDVRCNEKIHSFYTHSWSYYSGQILRGAKFFEQIIRDLKKINIMINGINIL